MRQGEDKQSFFEKKDQKTFTCFAVARALLAKVFWFFFSEKNDLPFLNAHSIAQPDA